MKTKTILLLTIIALFCSCKKDSDVFPSYTYFGCHGFAQAEYTFDITPQTKSITIGTWRKPDARDNEATIYLYHLSHKSTAIKDTHFKADESLEDNEFREFQTVFAGTGLTSTCTIPVIPENITGPVTITLRYTNSHYVSKDGLDPVETIIHLNPAQ